MRFYLKRLYYGIQQRKAWLLLVFLLPILFILLSALIPDRFAITQKIAIQPDAPVALASTPTGYGQARSVVADSSNFFMNHFALRAFYNQLNNGAGDYRSDPQFRFLAEEVKTNMTLIIVESAMVQVGYLGRDRQLGAALVAFYAQRLVHKGIEGLTRSDAHGQQPLPTLQGEADVQYQRALWRVERLKPLLQLTILSVVAVLLLMVVLEWSDPALKSERQVARYVNLPILGSLPDVNRVYAAMEKHTSG